jgi:16S rRNA C967 or C1407 C5-methylase (RsmB/RsmF family)
MVFPLFFLILQSNMQLPEVFVRETKQLMGEERFRRFMEAFNEDAPVSIRVNKRKVESGKWKENTYINKVPWCEEGIYLEGRPQFTFDPLFHAGYYYVQEAASMFVTHVLRSLFTIHCSLFTVLDLCAAPGGKSTAVRTVLPEGSTLVSNEPIPTRAQILLENITKWGWPDCIVTNNYPRDFRKAKAKFDIILCDVPCSGEGMFRKDPATISEWSPQNVEKCWRLQREIVADAWECLNPGGLLIYSTCTYNIKENEENIRWILDTYEAEALDIPVDPSWNITGSLLPGFDAPVYRFIPGITCSEGLFLCALHKRGKWKEESGKRLPKREQSLQKNRLPSPLKELSAAELFSFLFPLSSFHIDLSYPEALKYLRGEALALPPDTPKGIVTVTYKGVPLGPVKNIGNRANNLYPKPWRIKTTHLPTEEIKIIDIQ